MPVYAQSKPTTATVPDKPANTVAPSSTVPQAATNGLLAWEGLNIQAVKFEGVDRLRLQPLPAQLPLQAGHSLKAQDVRESLRRLFATGLYRGIEVEGVRQGDAVTIIFKGTATLFLGRITVEGLKSDRLASQLVHASRLNPGTTFSDAKLVQAGTNLKETLQDNGFYLGSIATNTAVDTKDGQVNVRFVVNSGKQARIGDVKVTGNPGMSTETFRKKGKLKQGSKVSHDTVNRALSRLRKNYQKQQRLEANVALESKNFQKEVDLLDYAFQAEQGPV